MFPGHLLLEQLQDHWKEGNLRNVVTLEKMSLTARGANQYGYSLWMSLVLNKLQGMTNQ